MSIPHICFAPKQTDAGTQQMAWKRSSIRVKKTNNQPMAVLDGTDKSELTLQIQWVLLFFAG
ncbi:hypothetical protein N9053_02250 [bacterium]|nr:hypothetical protein [bacterium]